MIWRNIPNAPGYWFFTKSLDDWDVSTPVAVSMHSLDGMTWTPMTGWKDPVKVGDGWWYGPFTPHRPDETATQATAECDGGWKRNN